ncbi:MAG: DUF1501 domain-containing protein [Pirellulaceae bacterium]
MAGSVLWPSLLQEILADAGGGREENDPLAPKTPHFPPRAKNVVFLYMSGGVSHVDTFDHKPSLFKDHGKEVVVDHPETQNRPGYEKTFLKRPQWEFRPRGVSGTLVSDLFPHMGACVDEIALIRSMHTSHSNHYNATLGMHTGSFTVSRPSIGSWVSYGLGSENRDLPSFITIAPQTPYAGTQVWASDFLPPAYQGTRIIPGAEAMPNLTRRVPTQRRQELELEALARMNRRHLQMQDETAELSARIKTFETAFGMQMRMPEIFDLKQEADHTLDLYGLERDQVRGFGWQCLVARRLVERGVRFVELIDVGSSNNWDAHGDMKSHEPLARNVDRPIAGLLTDLKQRGLLNETLVVWTTEFGRTPFNNTADAPGREHHNWAFSSWLAGGGVKAGVVHGTTDEHGIRVAENPVHVHDLHATILHLLGLNHERHTFRHSGRDFRLTDVHGRIVHEILA